GEINRRMPEFVRDKALRILNHAGIASAEARILVLGIAYKKDIKDERESPSIDVIKLLQAEGVEISYHDPFIPECNSHGLIMNSIPLTKQSITEADLVLIATDHSSIDYQWVVQNARRVFDTRNATRNVSEGREKITLL
ncbi:MAG TPA: UDP-N-acetyl-D-glucosamine dehydrogenase, partial [Syntrophomonadaceae bacterium]|nr:UDP-N-acetyl-D-glucosamine dehydrogenase [Syntrophomonadaceae bacterium]